MLSPNEFQHQPDGTDTVKSWFGARLIRDHRDECVVSNPAIVLIGGNGWF
jgi:hypothetical protein